MKKFMYGLAAMSLSLAFTGCDDEDPDLGNGNGGDGECLLDAECDGYKCDLSDAGEDEAGVCLTECIQQSDCAEGYECGDGGDCVAEGGAGKIYNKVVLVSRTPNDSSVGGDCREPNPGPDIDYVRGEKNGEVVPATTASGQHGSYCGSSEVSEWADPGVVLEQLSIGFNEEGQEEPGYCAIENAAEKYFFMGTGQNYVAGETIQEGTGVLLVELAAALQDGDLIEVGEVGIEPGSDGEGQTCDEGPQTERPGDIFSIYIASSDVDSVGVGTVLEAPDFILVEESAIGLTKSIVTID